MATPHPLDPLNPVELEAAVAALRGAGDLTDERRLISLELVEPSKEDLRRSDEGATLPRRAFAVVLEPASSTTIEVVVAVATGEVEITADRGRRPPGDPPRRGGPGGGGDQGRPAFLGALAARGIDDIDAVMVDIWSAGNFGTADDRGPRRQGPCPGTASGPTDNGYARPIEGVVASSTSTRWRWCASTTTASCRCRRDGNYAGGPSVPHPRPISSRSRSSSPRGRASRSTATRCAGRSGASAIGFTRARGSCCTRSATRTAGACARSCTGRRSARWSSPTATRARRYFRKNAFDIGEYGIGMLAQLAGAGLRLPGRDPLLRRAPRRRAAASR